MAQQTQEQAKRTFATLTRAWNALETTLLALGKQGADSEVVCLLEEAQEQVTAASITHYTMCMQQWGEEGVDTLQQAGTLLAQTN